MFDVFDVLHIISYKYIMNTTYKDRIILSYNYIKTQDIEQPDYPFFDDIMKDITKRKQLTYLKSGYYPQNISYNTRIIKLELKVIKHTLRKFGVFYLTDYNADYFIPSVNYGYQITLFDLLIKKKRNFKMVFDTLKNAVSNNFSTRAPFEKKAQKNFALFKPLHDILSKNQTDLASFLQAQGFAKKGNMYSKDNIKVLLYTDNQKAHFLDIIKQKCQENCYMANNSAYNCGRTFIVCLIDTKMFVFSPDYKEPNPLQIPKSLIVNELEKMLNKK